MPGYLGRGCGQVGQEQGKRGEPGLRWCAKHTKGAIFTKLYTNDALKSGEFQHPASETPEARA